MMLIRIFLGVVDEAIVWALCRAPAAMPFRWKKVLAMYFPDARIRKLYWATLGVTMGENTYSNFGLTVIKSDGERGAVVFGNQVSIGPNVTIITDSSPNNSESLRQIPHVKKCLIKNAPVIIEDEVWIGAGATFLPGVRIGRGAIVGAHSLVRENVLPGTIVAGIPAKLIRTLL